MAKLATKLRSAQGRQLAVVVSIESRILILRQQKVVLATALAELYGVTVKRLNEQVKRNQQRFPADFMFQLTPKEMKSLRSQFATSNKGRGGRRFLPYAFTEHGAAMAATVLNSKEAVNMSVFVVRAFVRMRAMLADNGRIASKIEELEQRLGTHDNTIQAIIDAIKKLMTPLPSARRKIGFQLPAGKAGLQQSIAARRRPLL
jgi:hypothetical protein